MIVLDHSHSLGAALRSAAPYLRLYQGRNFVIKAGGEAFEDEEDLQSLLEQVATLYRLGIRVVLVHGGGPQINRVCDRMGIATRLVDGRRVTDADTLAAATMVLNGELNTRIVALFRQFDVSAVGISCANAHLATAVRREPQILKNGEQVDYGHVGEIQTIDPSVLKHMLDHNLLPVVSPICADNDGNVLNANADGVASKLAVALQAEKLIFMTAVPGILTDLNNPGSLISYTDVSGLRRMQEEGVLSRGMLPKAASIIEALEKGVPRVHVISHQIDNSLLIEVFTNEGSGTLIVRQTEQLRPEEMVLLRRGPATEGAAR